MQFSPIVLLVRGEMPGGVAKRHKTFCEIEMLDPSAAQSLTQICMASPVPRYRTAAKLAKPITRIRLARIFFAKQSITSYPIAKSNNNVSQLLSFSLQELARFSSSQTIFLSR